MDDQGFALIERLEAQRSLLLEHYELLLSSYTPELAAFAAERARAVREPIYGRAVFIRGLIEVSNVCANDCFYCGIRCSNVSAERYRLDKDDILSCAHEGYKLGFRSFVMQGGEDSELTDEKLCELIAALKSAHPDCAITLSLGERSHTSYQRLREAGADRYLLRHETADSAHYHRLHPKAMSHEKRLSCLASLRELGYAVGSGMMVGSPFQTTQNLAQDLVLIERLRPQMCGIGPFVPHHATPFAGKPAGSVELTCFVLSLLRLMRPGMLIPSTTALGTLDAHGREKGILAGANVVMPNLSPAQVRAKYELYDNKAYSGTEAAEGLADLRARMHAIGHEIVVDRGDPRTTD